MSVTILEVLQNAKYNLCDSKPIALQQAIGKEQLKNGLTLLEKGYGLDENFDALIEDYETVDQVPVKDSLK